MKYFADISSKICVHTLGQIINVISSKACKNVFLLNSQFDEKPIRKFNPNFRRHIIISKNSFGFESLNITYN